MKQIRIFAAMCAALILAGCNFPVQPPKAEGAAGAVVVRLAAPERTIMPSTPVFSRYALTVTEGGTAVAAERISGDVSSSTGVTISGIKPALALAVTVNAYASYPTGAESAAEEYLAATGSWSGTPKPGDTVTAAITLKPVPVAETASAGIFSYALTLPAAAQIATLQLGDDPAIDLLTTAASGLITKAPGYYPLKITLAQENPRRESVFFEYVHLYSGLESKLIKDFSAAVFADKVYVAGLASMTEDGNGTVAAYTAYVGAGDPGNVPVVGMDGVTPASAAVASGKWHLVLPPAAVGQTIIIVLTDTNTTTAAYYSGLTLATAALPIQGIAGLSFPVGDGAPYSSNDLTQLAAAITAAGDAADDYTLVSFGLAVPRNEKWVNQTTVDTLGTAKTAAQTFYDGISAGTTHGDVVDQIELLETAIDTFHAAAVNGFGYQLVTVPAGKFQRDSGAASVITIGSDYLVSTWEVTQELYYAVTGVQPASQVATGALIPVARMGSFKALAFLNKLSLLMGLDPVYTMRNLNANGTLASGYMDNAAWLSFDFSTAMTSDNFRDSWMNNVSCDFTKNGYRLPTEMEWMWAAMGADKTIADMQNGVNISGYAKGYAGGPASGDESALFDHAWVQGNSGGAPHAVGGKLPNELGLYDMSGNVAEYCWDWENNGTNGSYAWTAPATDPTGDAARRQRKVSRGGDWKNDPGTSGYRYRLASRVGSFIQTEYDDVGFRLVRNDPDAASAQTPDMAVTVTVTFTAPADETITLSDVSGTPVSWAANTQLTVTVTETFTSYQWYLDGAVLSGQTGNSVTLSARSLRAGAHDLSLRISKDGVRYSKTLTFTVQ